MQLAAAVAAHGDQRELRGRLAEVHAPGAHECDVDEPGAVTHQVLDRLVGLEALPELAVAGLEGVAELPDGLRAGRDPGFRQLGARVRGGRRLVLRGAQMRPSAPRVSTSCPSSVTRMVCSHWADNE